MKAMLSWPIAAGVGTIVLLFVTTAQAQTVIDTVAELEDIQNNLFGNYVLGANINASGVTNFTPIGSASDPFYGTLNGSYNGTVYTISNLTINSSLDNVGLFGESYGTIQNLNLTNESITATAANPNVGGIAGINVGTITQSSSNGGAIYATASGYSAVGGLVGDNGGTISSSHSSNSIQVSSGAGGGVAGVNGGTISQSYATGSVSGGNSSYVGGLIGQSGSFGPYGDYGFNNLFAPVTQSYATGNVTGGSQSYVGGLIGINGSGVAGSYATGNVFGGSSSEVGGLIGALNQEGSLSQSFATGSVTGSASRDVGGLVGWNEDATISQTYARSAVFGNGSAHVGGLVGENGGGCWPCSASIDQSYAAGLVSNIGGQVGGLVGLNYPSGQTYDPGVVTNSYWDSTASGQPTSSGGTPLPRSKLQSGSLPTGFDPTVWSATVGSYPTLTGNYPPTASGVGSGPASPDQLAIMSKNVTSGNESAISSLYGSTTFEYLGNNSSDFYPALGAAAYVSEDTSQVVIAFRGTDVSLDLTSIKNIAADTSFATGDVSANLLASVDEAASYVAKIHAELPNANITLTGWSLGGAVAQIIGQDTGYATTVFDAPGAGGSVYASLTDPSSSSYSPQLAALPHSLVQNENINYREYGDVVSQFGTRFQGPNDSTITLPADYSGTFSYSTNETAVTNNEAYIVAAHSIDNFLNENIEAPGISTVGEPDLAPILENDILHPTSIAYRVAALELGFVTDVATVEDALTGRLFDPESGSEFTLQDGAGSPYLSSIDLPTIDGVSLYEFRDEVNGIWSSFELLAPGTLLALPPDVTGVEFDPLNSLEDQVTIQGGFLFYLNFSGPGTFSATLTEPLPIPETSTWLMILIGLAIVAGGRTSARCRCSTTAGIASGTLSL
jgi:hypothetical protein